MDSTKSAVLVDNIQIIVVFMFTMIFNFSVNQFQTFYLNLTNSKSGFDN